MTRASRQQGEALLKVFYETVYQDPPNIAL